MRLFVLVVFLLSNLSCNPTTRKPVDELPFDSTQDRELFDISKEVDYLINVYDGTCVEWAGAQIDVYLGLTSQYGITKDYYTYLMDVLSYLYDEPGGGSPYRALEYYYKSLGYKVEYLDLHSCLDYAVIADRLQSGCEAVVFMSNPITESHVETIVSVYLDARLSDPYYYDDPLSCHFISNSWGAKMKISGFSDESYYHEYFWDYCSPNTEAHTMTICPN